MEREAFGSRIGFIFAAAASAIGLGNFWRFPYLVEKFGGGTFILIYIVSALTFGIILVTLEVAVGRMTGKSIIEAYRELIGKYKWVGWITVVISMVLLGYYCVIGGWVLKYAFSFITGDVSMFGDLQQSSDYFENFVADTGDILNGPVIWFVIFLVISILFVVRGLNKGAEFVSKVFMPILIILMIVLIISTLGIPGIWDGIAKTFIPTAEGLNVDSVAAAMGQVFFSVSVGAGVLVAYGSYLSKKTEINSTVRIIVVMECFVAICCALIVVPVVCVYAGEVSVSGSGLMFKVLPTLFNKMSLGTFMGTLFFVVVFFAAWTSSVSLSEAIVSPLYDTCRINRRKGALIALIASGTIGILCCLSYGGLSGVTIGDMYILDFVDFASSNILMPISAMIMCIVIGYFVGTGRVLDEIGVERNSKFGMYFKVMIMFICPLILIFIFITGIT